MYTFSFVRFRGGNFNLANEARGPMFKVIIIDNPTTTNYGEISRMICYNNTQNMDPFAPNMYKTKF